VQRSGQRKDESGRMLMCAVQVCSEVVMVEERRKKRKKMVRLSCEIASVWREKI